jgi:phosphatidylglycerol:prolipoprotein diacylglycerol transferase
VWQGGMAFHGGLIGAAIGVWLFARRYRVSVLSVFDLTSLVAPIGLFFGRLANFIRPELWGRPTDVPWAMVFPGSDGQPRHPSQLYEAALEGVAIFVVLQAGARVGWLRHPGRIAGVFGVLYALARTFSEFFRDPDPISEDLGGGLTMGMLLSAPMLLIGLALIFHSLAKARTAA